ncbi:MAG: NUDIX hydrolase [Candidatus Uhrbacteria bacterium]|nr:NUDIX hydrolase [Candidatus Uhrbacteria bacterium]
MSVTIPPEAKKVFDGVMFEVWQWEQEVYDGTTHTYERLRRRDTGTAIPIVGDKILIEHQEQPSRDPFISFPGGMIEYGADPLQETARELLEETGYDAQELVYFKTFSPSRLILWNSIFYIARNCKKIQEPTPEGGERIAIELISFDDFLELADNPMFRHKDLEATLVRARCSAEKQSELKRLLFGIDLNPTP